MNKPLLWILCLGCLIAAWSLLKDFHEYKVRSRLRWLMLGCCLYVAVMAGLLAQFGDWS